MIETKQIMPHACKKCGSIPNIYLKKLNEESVWFVQCPNCEAAVDYYTSRDVAVSSWNSENKEPVNS